MRETARSLRTYFIVVAFWSGAMCFMNFRGGFSTVLSTLGLLIALAYLYCGIRLETLLRTSPHIITGVLIFAASALVAGFLTSLLWVGVDLMSIASLPIGLVVIGYLLLNVRRLAAESHQASPTR